jgi:hypothetical protein
MLEVSVSATTLFTIIIVWVVSFVVSRLDSLPIDMTVAAASLVLLFFDTAEKALQGVTIPAGSNPIMMVAGVVFFSLLGVFFCITVYMISKNGLPADSADRNGKLNDAEYRKLGYWGSLILSTILFTFTISAANNSSKIVLLNTGERGFIGAFLDQVYSGFSPFSAIVALILFLGVTALYRRKIG